MRLRDFLLIFVSGIIFGMVVADLHPWPANAQTKLPPPEETRTVWKISPHSTMYRQYTPHHTCYVLETGDPDSMAGMKGALSCVD